jgi:hypothetical protein
MKCLSFFTLLFAAMVSNAKLPADGNSFQTKKNKFAEGMFLTILKNESGFWNWRKFVFKTNN